MNSPIVETVKDIYYTGSHFFNNTIFDNYIVYLHDYDEPFKMTKKNRKDVDFIPRIGDKITFYFDENDEYRLKNVKLCLDVV